MKHVWLQSILVGAQRIKGKFIRLICVLALVFVSCIAVFQIAEHSFNQGDFKWKVALVVLDETPDLDVLIDMALSSKEISKSYDVQRLDSEEDGVAMVQDNEAYACVVIPEGFLVGLASGHNVAPTVVLHETNTVDAAVVYALVETLANMVQATQSGLYTAIEEVYKAGTMDDSFYLQSNLHYIVTVLARAKTFDNADLPYEKVLEMGQHYALTLGVYLLLLSMALFYPNCNIRQDFLLLKQLRACTNHHQTFYFAQVLVIYLVYVFIFVGAIGCLQGRFTVVGVVSLLNAAALFVLMQCLLFQLIGQSTAAMFFSFVLHSVALFAVGGVIPTLFLPSIWVRFAAICPLYYIRLLLSSLFVQMPNLLWLNVGVLGANLLLVMLLWAINEFVLRRASEYGSIS